MQRLDKDVCLLCSVGRKRRVVIFELWVLSRVSFRSALISTFLSVVELMYVKAISKEMVLVA
ncbi:unnamed protein product [Brugia pahangi]|uniref:Ovule protein n=1 Tax=Brugia pahangi TaxID=6280 RepID=A0A0N4T8J0_BRUPA|nr:unnamed protein product [Brugia pahangi]